jgi:hypothetical protein
MGVGVILAFGASISFIVTQHIAYHQHSRNVMNATGYCNPIRIYRGVLSL